MKRTRPLTTCCQLLVATAMICLMSCSNGDDDYQGIRLDKNLIESIAENFDYKNVVFFNLGEYVIVDHLVDDGLRKKGFILLDQNGNVACKREDIATDNIGCFSNGLAAVINSSTWGLKTTQGMWGIMNAQGEFVLPPEYDFISMWAAGNATIVKDNLVGVVNDKGELVVPLGNYSLLVCLDNGLIMAVKEKKIGLLDNKGQEIVPFEHEKMEISGDLVLLYKNSKWGVLDKNGKEVQPFQYDYILVCAQKDYEYTVLKKGEQSIYLDKNGQDVTQKCEEDVHYKNFTIAFTQDGKKGVTSLVCSDEIRVPFEYDDIMYSDNFFLAIKSIDDTWQYDVYSKRGELLYNFKTDKNIKIKESRDYYYYSTSKNENNEWGLYDLKTGKNLIPHEYKYKFDFYDKFIRADKGKDENRETCLFSNSGKKVYSGKITVMLKLLNGYYSHNDINTKTCFFDAYGNHLFDIDKFFEIKENECYLRNNQQKMMKYLSEKYLVGL